MSNRIKEIVRQIQYKNDWTVAQVAESIGYSRVHLTRAIKEGSDSVEKALMDKHRSIFIDQIAETVHNIASEQESEYYKQQYLDLLKSTNETLKDTVALSLNSVLENQRILRAISSTDLNQSVRIRAKLEGKSIEKVRDEINRELADNIRASLKMDTFLSSPGKKVKS